MSRDAASRLRESHDLPDGELLSLIASRENDERLRSEADGVRREIYSDEVYIRGLIEFTNYCGNDCYYCGIRRGNTALERYRLTKEEILACCDEGYRLGFRTFVLQGGEDRYYTDRAVCDIVSSVKERHEDCAVTLSIGEKSRESYAQYARAGADRYLLRHETANAEHYGRLHPASMSLDNRKRCLFDLKELGYQVGSGFMVGSPWQTNECILDDLRFLQQLDPDMIGIGPYIVHRDTPFRDMKSGSLELTLRLISMLRIMFPHALIPATTALGTVHPKGREMGLKAGANVVMPNLSPRGVRELYSLYDDKICTGEEAAQCISCLTARVRSAGYGIVVSAGNVKR
jgi:biotin synthase